MFKKSLLLMLLMAFMAPWAVNAQSTVLYEQGFEGLSSLPTGWTKVTTSSTVAIGSHPNTGSKSLDFTKAIYYSGSYINVVALPVIDAEYVTGSLSVSIYGKAEGNYASCGTFDVGYITDVTDPSTFVSVTNVSYSDYQSYTEITANLAAAPANARVALRHVPTSTSYYWYVDDVTVSGQLVTCPKPKNLTCSAFSTTTATFTWTNGDSENAWEIKYSTDADFDPDTEGTSVAADSNPFTISTGLTAETTYYAYVRANCSATDYSAWSNKCEFIPSAAVPKTVNEGTNTSAIVPVYYYYVNNSGRSQFIIPSSDLEDIQFGSIRRLMFYSTIESRNWGDAVFEVYVSEVNYTTYSSGTFESWSNMTKVYEGALSISDSKMLINFATPYNYNDGNLMIGIKETTNGTNGAYGDNWYGISTSSTSDYPAVYGYGSYEYRTQFKPKTTIYYIAGAAPSCLKPTGLGSTNETGSSAQLSWTARNGETSWKLAYKKASDADFGAPITVTENPYTLTGLDALTDYQFKVAAWCDPTDPDAVSDYSSVQDFSTDCGAINLPYSNNFDTETANTVPQCFSRLNAGTGSYPQVYNSSTYAHSGSKSVNFYYSSGYSNENQMLILPEIKSTVDLTLYQLTFWARTGTSSYTNQTFDIGVMTDKTDANTFYKVGTITVPDNTYREMTPVSFADYTGNGKYIAIKFTSCTSYPNIYIDDLSVELIPACSKPGNITTNNITGRSVDLTFDSNAGLWQVAYSTTNNFDPDNTEQCTYVTADENPFILSGLNPETTYRVRVRANCGTTESPVYSAWNNTQKTFTTTVLCEAPTALNSKNATSHSVQLYWTAGNEYQDTWDVAYSTTSNFTPENELGEPNEGVTIISGIQGNHSSESPYTLTGLPTQNTRYYFKVRSDCGSEDGKSSWSSQTYIYTQYGNNAPTAFTASNITTTGANLAWTGSAYNDLHASYEVYYSTESTTPGATPEAGDNYITGLTTASHTLSGLTPDTQYYVWVRDNCGDDGNSSWTALTGSSFNTLPTCEVPENLTCSAYTATTATLTWDAPEGQTAWLLYYSTSADTPAPELVSGEGIVAVETTASKTLESLTAETPYHAWVRGNCTAANNGYSAWSSVCNFMPSASLNVTVNNVTSSDPNYSTNEYVPVYGNYTDAYTRSQFIIPASDLTDVQWGTIKKLTFYVTSPNSYIWPSDKLNFKFFIKEVDYTAFTSSTFDWSGTTEVYDGDIFIEGNQMTIVFDTPYNYEDGNLLIGMNQTQKNSSYYTNTYWIGVETSTYTAKWGKTSNNSTGTDGTNQQFIPKTTINYIPGTQPSCLTPNGLTAADPNEDITATTATLTWTERGTATAWNLRYKEEGADEWITKSNITKPYKITGLTGNTNYEAQVQAVCNEDDEWSAVYTFTTDCGVIAVDATHPFIEDFEGSTFPPTACWQNPYNGSNKWSYNSSYNHTSSGYYSAYSGYNTVNLLMPEMNITGEHAVLTFWSYIYSTPYNKVAVAVSDNGGESFTEIWTDASITLGAWTKTEVLLDNSYIGNNIIIAFQNTSSWDHAWYLDDISIDVYDKIFNKITDNGLWTESANWSPAGEPVNTQSAFINGAATIPTGCTAIADNITIGKEGSLNIVDGGQLICNNNPEVTVQKNITAASQWGESEVAYSPNHWYFIASPISGDLTTSNLFTTEDDKDYDLYYFDEANTYWRNYKNTSFSIAQNHGYLYASKKGTTIQFSGTVQNDVTDGINVSIRKDGEGFNLVGNPFPFNAYVNRSYYTLDANGETVSATAVAQSNAITPCTGIIVKADGTEDEVVTFRRTAFTYGAVNNGNIQMALAQTVTTRGGNHLKTIDNAIVSFNEGSKLEKFYFMQQNANIYIPQNGEEFAIVNADAQGEMPVNFKANENGVFTITVNAEDVEMGYLHLIDNITGADVDLLSTPSYTFNAKSDDYASRFRLVFSANGINNEEASDDFAFISNGQIIVSNEGEATLQIVDITGRIISSETINGTFSKSLNAANGVYVLRLVNGDDVKTQKIVIR